MSLSAPTNRTLLHTRKTEFHGYLRDDGLWDIEATILDVKETEWPSYEKGVLKPGDPVHNMLIRLTLDDELVVKAIELQMAEAPYGECQGAVPGIQKLVGARVSKGWRRAISDAIGGIDGCTHVRELLVNMGTAAFQTIAGEIRRSNGQTITFMQVAKDSPPPHMGQCISWDFDGPVVERHHPEFFRWKPK